MSGDLAAKCAEMEWGNALWCAPKKAMALDTECPTTPVAVSAPRSRKSAIHTNVLSGKSPSGQGWVYPIKNSYIAIASILISTKNNLHSKASPTTSAVKAGCRWLKNSFMLRLSLSKYFNVCSLRKINFPSHKQTLSANKAPRMVWIDSSGSEYRRCFKVLDCSWVWS